MAEWRRVALTMIPELKKSIAGAYNRTELWDHLRESFVEASEGRDGTLCTQIVKYYRWCVDPARKPIPNDVQTSAVITFLEKMVRSPERIALLLKWITKEEVLFYAWNVAYSGGDETVEYIRKFR